MWAENKRKLVNAGIIALLAVSFILLLVNYLVLNHLEKSLSRLAADALEDAGPIKVRIAGTTPITLLAGRIGQVDCYGENLRLKDAPVIKSAAVTLTGVRFNLRELSSVDGVQVLIVLHQDDVNKYIRQRAELNPPFPVLEFQPDIVRASVRLPLIKSPASFSTEGEITVKDKNKLIFRASSVDLAGNRIGGAPVEILSQRVNPLLDLSSVKPVVEIEDFIIGVNNIRVFGRIKITEPIVFR